MKDWIKQTTTVDVGRLIRKHIHTKTRLGSLAASHHEKGLLIDNHVVLQMIVEKFNETKADVRGWVLHGYPVTGVQAEVCYLKCISNWEALMNMFFNVLLAFIKVLTKIDVYKIKTPSKLVCECCLSLHIITCSRA